MGIVNREFAFPPVNMALIVPGSGESAFHFGGMNGEDKQDPMCLCGAPSPQGSEGETGSVFSGPSRAERPPVWFVPSQHFSGKKLNLARNAITGVDGSRKKQRQFEL